MEEVAAVGCNCVTSSYQSPPEFVTTVAYFAVFQALRVRSVGEGIYHVVPSAFVDRSVADTIGRPYFAGMIILKASMMIK